MCLPLFLYPNKTPFHSHSNSLFPEEVKNLEVPNCAGQLGPARASPWHGTGLVRSGDIISTASKGSTQLQVHTVRAYTFLIPLVALTIELAHPTLP